MRPAVRSGWAAAIRIPIGPPMSRLAISHAGVVGRDDMKPIHQKRNEVVELVRRRGKTVQQEKRRRVLRAGLPVEDGKPVNLNRAIEGRGLHGTFILLGVGQKLKRREHHIDRQRQAGRFRECSPALADADRRRGR